MLLPEQRKDELSKKESDKATSFGLVKSSATTISSLRCSRVNFCLKNKGTISVKRRGPALCSNWDRLRCCRMVSAFNSLAGVLGCDVLSRLLLPCDFTHNVNVAQLKSCSLLYYGVCVLRKCCASWSHLTAWYAEMQQWVSLISILGQVLPSEFLLTT